jgi:DNA-directed RNA polymerase subunit RPC12/RpoP
MPMSNCPSCNSALPRVRVPSSFTQMMWGGCTCPKCGCEIDRKGNRIQSGTPSAAKNTLGCLFICYLIGSGLLCFFLSILGIPVLGLAILGVALVVAVIAIILQSKKQTNPPPLPRQHIMPETMRHDPQQCNTGGSTMSEFRFKCTSCGNALLISEQHRGQTVKCPHCSALTLADNQVPVLPELAHSNSSAATTTRCPYCAEEINAAAIKCKHCGSLIRDQASAFAAQGSPRTSGYAIASLVLGLIPLTCVPPILGVVFGHVALSKINESGGQLKGRGMATWGLVLGYIFTAINLIYGVCVGIAAIKK